MICRLDISKAYDSVSWLALTKNMSKFCFGERQINMIWILLSNCWYSILFNCQSIGYFSSNRGLKQGYPLSPYSYIIVVEVFSRGLKALHEKYYGLNYVTAAGAQNISHPAYADDIILF